MLEKLGLPDFKGWRFVTLTLDPAKFGYCPLTGYLEGKDKIRRFLEAGRIDGLWDRGTEWAWKLEFQRNGWAHWHLLINRKSKFSKAEMDRIHSNWNLGRTNCRRISKSQFGYQFKYAFKGVFQEDSEGSGLCVPQWFMDYFVRGKDGQKPKSFSRVRFWQTSKGFYDNKKPELEKEKKQQFRSLLPRPVSEVIHDSQRALLVISRDRSGRYQKSKRLHLGVTYENFIRVHLWDADWGYGCTLSARSFVLNPETIKKLIDKTELCQLYPLLQENHLTLKRALHLRRNRVSLETC